MSNHKKRPGKIFLPVIVLVFLIVQFFLLPSYQQVWWDEAVYVGMGRYLVSDGTQGLWESARPVVWPLLVGAITKFGIDPLDGSRVLALLFAAGILIMTYLITKEVFSDVAARWAVLLLVFFPTFFFFSSFSLTTIPSTLLVLVGLYYMLQARPFPAGIFYGLAVMTRFLQLFVVISLVGLFLVWQYRDNKKSFTFKPFFQIAISFLIILTPYLISNTLLYGNAFHPFFFQQELTNNSGWDFHQPWFWYLIQFAQEAALLLLFIPMAALILARKTKHSAAIKTIAGAALIIGLFFFIIAQKEMRFIIATAPLVVMLSGYAIAKLSSVKKWSIQTSLILGLILIAQFSLTIPTLHEQRTASTENQFISAFLKANKPTELWISNPVYLINTNARASELIYYPYLTEKRLQELSYRMPASTPIIVDTCDLACRPNDSACETEKERFISLLHNQPSAFRKTAGSCEQIIVFSAS